MSDLNSLRNTNNDLNVQINEDASSSNATTGVSSMIDFNNNDLEGVTSNKGKQQSSSMFGLCKICGDVANGFHYGVSSCEGCKGFYKRTLERKDKYRCYFGTSCPITPETRNRCKACRFEKCKQVGMSLESVKLGRMRKNEKQMLEMNSVSNAPTTLENEKRPGILESNKTTDEIIINSFFKNIFQSKNESAVITVANTTKSSYQSTMNVRRQEQADSTIYYESANENQIVQYARPPSPITTLLKALNNHESTTNLFSTKMHAVYMQHSNRIITSLHQANAVITMNRLFEGKNLTRKDIWAGLLLAINLEIKSLIAFVRDIPGLSDLYSPDDFPFIMNDLLFDYFMIMNAPLHINGESFYILPNGAQYPRKWMIELIGEESTQSRFTFADRLTELDLTNKEKALLFPFVFTMNYYKLQIPDRVRNAHEYYMKVFVSEMVKNQRDSAFIERLKQTISMLPYLNELERQYSRKTKPVIEELIT